MLMYNVIEHSDDYPQTSWGVWQYHKDIPNDNIPNSDLFKFKARITGTTLPNSNTTSV